MSSHEMKLAQMLSGPTKTEIDEEERLELEAMEKISMADQWGRDLARAYFEKTAGPIGGIGRAIGTGMKALTTSSHGTRALVGAGVGAAGGAIRGAGTDEQGRPRSMLGNIAGGALLGAGAGVGAGYGAKALGSMKGGTGDYLRKAQAVVSKGTSAADKASMNAVRQMGTAAKGGAPAVKAVPKQGTDVNKAVENTKKWLGETPVPTQAPVKAVPKAAPQQQNLAARGAAAKNDPAVQQRLQAMRNNPNYGGGAPAPAPAAPTPAAPAAPMRTSVGPPPDMDASFGAIARPAAPKTVPLPKPVPGMRNA